MRTLNIINKYTATIMIATLVIVIIFSAIGYTNQKKNLHVYKHFIQNEIMWFGDIFRTEPDSISDLIGFSQHPYFDWHQYSPPYLTFDSSKINKLLKASNLIISRDSGITVYIDTESNRFVDLEEYSFINYILNDKNITVSRMAFFKANSIDRYYLALFKDYDMVDDSATITHFGRKLKKFNADFFNTNFLPTLNSDSTTLFYHVKKQSDGFTYKIAYAPEYISKSTADSVFQLLKTEYLNDSLNVRFDRINIPVVIPKNKL